jgi:hypothetical protein
MADKNDGPKDTGDPAISAPPVGETEPKNPVPSKPATEADLEQVKKQMSGFERSTLKWTRASFIVILATGIFIALQWREMHTGGEDTHALAEAAKTQAEKMKTMSEAADKIKEATEGMVGQEKKIVDSSQKSIEASNRQSKASLDATIAQFRDEQRAWVGAVEFGRPNNLEIGKKATFNFVVSNSGKTPALHVTQRIAAWPFAKGQEFHPVWTPITTQSAVIVLQPGMRITISTNEQFAPNTETTIARLKTGEEVMYVYGEITYKDVAGRTHYSHFCAYIAPDLITGSVCTTYNDAN